MASMKNAITVLVLLSLLALVVEPVEAFDAKGLGKKAVAAVRKGVMLPVYVIGGAGAGVVVWLHYGGQEGKLSTLFKGAKK